MPRNSVRSKGRRRVTQEQYEAMVQVHRADFGAHKAAAEAGGVSYNTALKFFREGGKSDKMPPIRTLISQEMVEARAQLSRMKEGENKQRDAAAAASKDMAEARAMQARSLRMARNNSIAAMGMGANLLRSGLQLSVRVEKLMSDDDWTPSPREAVNLLRGISEINRQAIEMASASEQMEARILGQPDIVVGHVDMTPDQAVTTLYEGQRTLERLKRRAARGDLPPGVSPSILDVEPVDKPLNATDAPAELPAAAEAPAAEESPEPQEAAV